MCNDSAYSLSDRLFIALPLSISWCLWGTLLWMNSGGGGVTGSATQTLILLHNWFLTDLPEKVLQFAHVDEDELDSVC